MAGGVTVDINSNSRGFRRGMNRNKSFLSRWAKSVARKMSALGRNIGRRLIGGITSAIRRGAYVAGGVLAAGMGKSVSEAGRFETYEMQFEALMGGADKAKKRMEEIKKVDLEVPFDITSIADASRVLEVFTEGAYASTDALKFMADAAAVTPNDIKDVAFWYGRAYSMIKAGRPFGEAAMRLKEMGLLTASATIELEKMEGTSGPTSMAKKLKILNESVGRFGGAAAKMAKTWKGVLSIFTSGSKQAFAAIGDEILPLAKTWLQELIDKMQELRESGTLAMWGRNVASGLRNARSFLEEFIPKLKGWVEELIGIISDKRVSEVLSKHIEKGINSAWDQLVLFFEDDRTQDVLNAAKEFGLDIGAAIKDGIVEEVKRLPVIGAQARFLEDASAFAGRAAGAAEAVNASGLGGMASRSNSISGLYGTLQGVGNKMRTPGFMASALAPIMAGDYLRRQITKVVIADVDTPAKEKLNPETPRGDQ